MIVKALFRTYSGHSSSEDADPKTLLGIFHDDEKGTADQKIETIKRVFTPILGADFEVQQLELL